MYLALTIIIAIAAVFLIVLVLAQDSKSGGLAAGFASGNQVLGAPKTAEFLEKASWTLAGVIVGLSILAVGIKINESGFRDLDNDQEVVEQTMDEAPAEAAEAPADAQ